jgi:uncharacterized glyoxalase superfamily metalloenzyme YdcJ
VQCFHRRENHFGLEEKRMKRVFVILALAVALPAALFAQGNPFTSRDFQMVYEGNALAKPIDVDKLNKAAVIALKTFHWEVQSNENGKITARYEKDHGKINAVIEISVSAEGYSIKYISSKGLDVDLKNMKIHTNYIKWIRNLIKDIELDYLR